MFASRLRNVRKSKLEIKPVESQMHELQNKDLNATVNWMSNDTFLFLRTVQSRPIAVLERKIRGGTDGLMVNKRPRLCITCARPLQMF